MISNQVFDSVTPFAVGVAAMCACAGASVFMVRRAIPHDAAQPATIG